jgi:hypothetical protein
VTIDAKTRKKLRGSGISTIGFLVILCGAGFIFLNKKGFGEALLIPGTIIFFIGMFMHFKAMFIDNK